jgi:hypothetical protein
MKPFIIFIMIVIGAIAQQDTGHDTLSVSPPTLQTIGPHPDIQSTIAESQQLDSERSGQDMARAMSLNIQSIYSLYNTRIKANSKLHGRMVVVIRINQRGIVVSYRDSVDTMRDSVFSSMVKDQIKHWTFDPIKKLDDQSDDEIVFPLNFKSKEE